MAKIRVEIGPLHAEATVADAVAAQMAADYLAQYGLDDEGATNQQRLDAFLRAIVRHVKEASDATAIVRAVDERRAEVRAERAAVRWGTA